jgi:hypothetical protein
MMSALGASRSLLDALQFLTSSRSSSAAASAISGENAADSFGPGTKPQGHAGNRASSGSSGHAISPQTMSALIDAQSQSGSANSEPANPSDADTSADSSDTNSSTNQLHPVAMTLVQLPPTYVVRLDPTGLVNTVVGPIPLSSLRRSSISI